jgi:hypothetical protein
VPASPLGTAENAYPAVDLMAHVYLRCHEYRRGRTVRLQRVFGLRRAASKGIAATDRD